MRDAVRADTRGTPRWRLPLCLLLALLVAVTAGIAGTTHFSGPRWVPHWSLSGPTRRAKPSAATAPHVPKLTPATHGPSHLPLEPVLWAVAALALLGVTFLLWRWWSRRRARAGRDVHVAAVATTRDPPATPEPEPEPEPETVRSGIERALQVLDEQREPSDAIVLAWLGLEETAEESGIVRRPSETPTELTARILRGVFTDDRAIRTLLRLYLQTRFGDHPVTEEDVSSVRTALHDLLRTWRFAEPASTRVR